MNPSRSRAWQRVRRLEDILAILSSVLDRQQVIRVQAWREGDWGTVFREATTQGVELRLLQEELVTRWDELYGEVHDGPPERCTLGKEE